MTTRAPSRGTVLHRERQPVRGAKGVIEHVSEVEWEESAAAHARHTHADAERDAVVMAGLSAQLAMAEGARRPGLRIGFGYATHRP